MKWHFKLAVRALSRFRLARDFTSFCQTILLLFSSFYIVGICSQLLLIEIKRVMSNWVAFIQFTLETVVTILFSFLQHQATNHNFQEVLALLIQLFGSFVCVFGICEFGERVCIAFDEINTKLDQLRWYLLPHKTQTMLLIISIFAQKPIRFNIFGSVSCNRETFKDVSSICNIQYPEYIQNLGPVTNWFLIHYLGLPSSYFYVYIAPTIR